MTRAVFGLIMCISMAGCAIKDEVKDGLWEIRSQVRTASFTQGPDDTLKLEFNFEYLLGLVDDEGIEEVSWTFALVDTDKNELASESQPMREAQLDRKEVFVQGERPRELSIEKALIDPAETYVLWITVNYRETILTEVLVPVRVGESYLNEAPLGDIEVLSTR